MSNLTAIFGQSAGKSSPDDEKLVDLYWNRNQLKKEFAELRKEKFELTDRLKIQKGDFARLEQKIKHLEELLVAPETCHSVLVLYQLRGCCDRLTAKMARFAERLKRQRERKKHGEALERWRAAMARDVAGAEEEIGLLREAVYKLEEQLQQLHHRFNSMNAIVRFFRRRWVNRQAMAISGEIEALKLQEEELRATIQDIQNRQPPENMGLNIAEKRSINFMILAFAQELYSQFKDDVLVELVKEASDKSAGAVHYGTDHECEEVLERLRTCEKRLSAGGDFTDALKKRAKLLAESAEFQGEDFAAPVAASVATLYRFGKNGAVQTSVADLLGQNFWNVAGVLSR